MTNYEKIKSMSLEDMAKFMYSAEDNIILPPCNKKYCKAWIDGYNCKYVGKANCKQATKNWLESEVEE